MTGGRKHRSIYYARFQQKCLGNPEAAEYRANAALLYLAASMRLDLLRLLPSVATAPMMATAIKLAMRREMVDFCSL
jgi:hypothetical protein